jgi:hypothetical protein
MENYPKQLELNLDFNAYDRKPPESFNIDFSNEVILKNLRQALNRAESDRLCDNTKYKISGPGCSIKDYGRYKFDNKTVRIYHIIPGSHNDIFEGFEAGFNHINVPITANPIEITISSFHREQFTRKQLPYEIKFIL